MTTYTIAMLDDMLLATAVDGDEAMMAKRLEDTLSQLDPEREEQNRANITYVSGLTLFQAEEDAEEAGAEIVYSGTQMGWLEDADGNMAYEAAGRV